MVPRLERTRVLALVALLLAGVLAAPDAAAQDPDWDRVYRRARVAGWMAPVAPVAGLAVGLPMVLAGRDDPLAAITIAPLGVMIICTGFAATAPILAGSGLRGSRALIELGSPVTRVPGTLSWVGTGVAGAGAGLVLTGLAWEDLEVDLLEPGLVVMLLGAGTALVAGIVQWSVNRAAWRGDAPPTSRLLGFSARF